MIRLRSRGAAVVDAGTYWNFETGKKFRLEQKGVLPGDHSQSYYKAPPFLILAGAAAAAHFFIYLLPKYLVKFYEAYTDSLVTAYVIFDYILIAAALISILIVIIGDVFGRGLKVPSFQWRPGTSYLFRNDDEAEKRHKKRSDNNTKE